jgi:hypothetical protein
MIIVTNQLITQFFLKRAYILICSFLILLPQTYAANEFITGFEMSSCAKNKCNTLIVEGSVEKGLLAPLFAFAKARLIHKDQNKKSTTELNALDGYYDSKHSEIVLRGVKELGGGESLINLKTGEIKVFAKK